ncbi:electron transport complex subunit RsxC [Halopseudomonas aestusnigri]|jgi:electron transport complex protein RnfC|uniref:electron transport complex subunit RsxC n=1 Tax=Halopseudomonas aestusnigri TaxID=857252 RepID=UPI000C8E6231|nr:electron transport complex subunit RsxC [Pseudomonadales bacterium]MAP76379.1 electron transport complex subunit RsxC [Pseudomonadales bacterium]MCK5529657.1 electron transport complex subunit RsxC [Halopseudomonas aestusnigri]HCP02172.1 electron transport complex subunit RsxC [Pseudomonas sp.]|tara:strand:- start:25726 stop:28095 length:2370 start_codon:yes stop_codon:yes gene_type:complete
MTAASPIRIWDIPGGIHPQENKLQSLGHGIETPPLPRELIVPLQQHIGARAEPCVAVSEKVLKGQLIAEASGFVSCPLHAPTSGTVTAIGPAPYPHASGLEEWAIRIEADGEDRWCELDPISDFRALEPAALLDIIRAAGISGLGGAGFPTAVKLKARPEQKIHTLIINGTECEPYITADDSAMRYRAEQIVSGIEVLMHILRPEQVLIGIEDNKPEAIEAMRAAVGERPMQVVVFPTKYPSGGEKQLIQILTGKEVPSGGLPADLGMVCQNVGTLLAIHDAVVLGQPLIKRITTLTGDALSHPTNVEALIGTPIRDLLTFAGLQPEKLYRLVMGGPMMGFTLQSMDAPIVKTTNCLLAGSKAELPPPPPAQPCIRCGLCAEACPASLLPQQLHFFALGKDYDQLKRQNLFDCIECGACSYVCPSSIPLVQYYRAAKSEIRALDLQQHKADHSRQRFEHRQERLQREAEQKERDRIARAEKAARLKAAKEAEAAKQADSDAAVPAADAPAPKAGGLTPEQKQLKIAAATAQMALKKAQKQLTANPDNADLQAQIPQLEQAVREAQEAFDKAQGEVSSQPAAPAPQAAGEDDAKKLKIEAAMLRAALKKAERAAGDSPSDEQQAEIAKLREQAEAAEARVPTTAAAKKPVDEKLKQAKLDLAMARAATRKTERALAESPEDADLQAQLATWQQALSAAEKALHEAENSSPIPPPERQRVDKKPVDEQLRELKTNLATTKADFKRAERELKDSTEAGADTAAAEQELATRRAALDIAAKAFADYMASKETN